MKKNFLLTMVIMLMTTISSFAQKEYNMVITLSNGTTVTLGHNDIKEITFNDGEVAISGNVVNTIDSLANVTLDLEYYSKNLDKKVVDIADALKVLIDGHVKDTDDKFSKIASYVKDTDDKFSKIASYVNANDETLQSISDFVQQQNEVNQILAKNIQILADYMVQLHPEIANSREYKAVQSALATARKK